MLRAERDRQQGSKQRQGFLGIFCGRRKRGFEFCELLICAVLMLYAGGSDQLADHRIKRTVLVIGRAVVDQSRMSLCGQPLLQRKRETRLADAGLAGYQHDRAGPYRVAFGDFLCRCHRAQHVFIGDLFSKAGQPRWRLEVELKLRRRCRL